MPKVLTSIAPIGPPPENRVMAYLQGYFDESGKHEQSRVVSFCGLVNGDWTEFEKQWASLARRTGTGVLHVAKHGLKPSSNEIVLYQRFTQVILRTVEQGFAMAVDVRAFGAMHRAVKSALGNDPHYLAFALALTELIQYAKALPDPSISVICDEDQKKACATYEMYRKFRDRNQTSRKVLKSIAFADDAHYPQLQAADLFAWVSRAESMHRFFGKDFPLRSLYQEFNLQIPNRVIGYKGEFWDQSRLQQFSRLSAVDLAKHRI